MTKGMIVCPRCWGQKEPFCDKCSNRGQIPNVWLSKNFSLQEFAHSPTAMSKRIPNDPTVKDLDRMILFCKGLLQPLREEMGILPITSGYRSMALNKAIGGAKASAHLVGYAADVQPKNCTLTDLMHWFKRTKFGFDQAIYEIEGRRLWVHIGYKHPATGQQRGQLLLNENGKWSPWKP
jgi:zinc D-Ala-D-Ala carboxypeptidase